MAALVAVMIMVSIGTFSWSSIKNLHAPTRKSSSVVMITVVVLVVMTHNLAIGVLAGVLLSGVFFAGKIAQIFRVTSALSADGRSRRYSVEGQLFYRLGRGLQPRLRLQGGARQGHHRLSAVRISGTSRVLAALDMVVLKFRREGAEVELVGMNEASETIVDRLALHDKPGAMDALQNH